MSWSADRMSGWCAFISGGAARTQTESPLTSVAPLAPSLAFELEVTTFLCPSVLKDQFPTHLDGFRLITATQ